MMCFQAPPDETEEEGVKEFNRIDSELVGFTCVCMCVGGGGGGGGA